MQSRHANSFCEWVVGANYTRRKKVRTTRRTVANLTWETDNTTDTDTIALSIPRGKRLASVARTKQAKQVRFASTVEEAHEDVKEVIVTDDTSGESQTSGSGSDSDCRSGGCAGNILNLKHTIQAGETADTTDTEVSEGTSTGASGDDTEEDIDSDCPCGTCVCARRILKKKKRGNQTAESMEPQSDAEMHARYKEKKSKEKFQTNNMSKDGDKGKKVKPEEG